MVNWPTDVEPMDCRWAIARQQETPEILIRSSAAKGFWRPLDRWSKEMLVLWTDREFDKLSDGIYERRTERATTLKDHVDGDPDRDYDTYFCHKWSGSHHNLFFEM